MKRSLVAILLVVALMMSCVYSVGAATMTKDEFLAACNELNRPVSAPTVIDGKLETASTYSNLVEGKIGDKAMFRATLDMSVVKEVVAGVKTKAAQKLEGSELDAFNALPVTGSFEFTATWTGVDAPADIAEGSLKGFAFDESTESAIFKEAATRTVVGNTLTATIEVEDTVIVASTDPDRRDTLDYLPEKITLVVDGFTITGAGEMNATIKGTTTIGGVVIDYTFSEEKDGDKYVIAPVDISIKSDRPNGGGTVVSVIHTLTYVNDDGSVIAEESCSKGKVVELTKVPEKEGYVFDGWYSDAELTNKITSLTINGDVKVYAAWKPVGDSPIGEVHPTPDKLNDGDHVAYMSGYPDGTIKPANQITRAEVATIFFRLLKDEVRAEYLSTENNFADVDADDWFNTAVSTMVKAGVINGRSEGVFAPNEYITRAEFATICARFDDADETSENKFTDIDGHWAESYILEAVAYKWIEGYEDSTFRPDSYITRAESATLINRVLVRIPENNEALLEDMKVWPDNNESAWYYLAIQEATNSHSYGRVNALNEKWTELVENRDWTSYEK